MVGLRLPLDDLMDHEVEVAGGIDQVSPVGSRRLGIIHGINADMFFEN